MKRNMLWCKPNSSRNNVEDNDDVDDDNDDENHFEYDDN